MFASMHPTPSSAGPKYGVGSNASGSKSYAAGSTVPARFAVHMYQKPGFGSYYPPANNVGPMKMDAVGYRPSMPQQAPYAAPTRYDDRYSPPHPHPAQPPRLNTAPSNLSRGYEPKPVPVSIPAPPTRVAPNFNIYPTGALDTFIYQQSQGSKSDLLSTSEFSSQASPTESISSTVTLRGADTPGTETSSLEPSPVEPSHSRRNSIVFNGGPSPTEEQFRSPSAGPGPRLSAGPAFPPHMLAAMNRTPSESSLDNREHIAIVNAQHNSVSTGSYYSSSPNPSTDSPPRASPPGSHTPMGPVPASIPTNIMPQRAPAAPAAGQQPMFTDAPYLHSSPEAMHAQVPQPMSSRSRSASPPQQHSQQQPYPAPERPASRHDMRRSQPTSSQPANVYGSSTPQMRRSPSQQANSSMLSTTPPTYTAGPEDYFSLPSATPTSHQQQHPPQQQQHSPNSSYTNIKHNLASAPRDGTYSYDRQDRRQGSASPPAMARQPSMGPSRDRSGSNPIPTSAGAGHHQRYSPPDRSMDLSMRSDDDRYSRERERDGVPRRERRQSNAAYPNNSAMESALSYSSSSGSSSGSGSTARGAEYSSRDRDRQRERDRDRDRERERERDRERDRDYYPPSSHRAPPVRKGSVYVDDASIQQQQSTVPFVRSSPPSPPNQPLKYTPPTRAPSYPPPSSCPPEKMSARTRTTSVSNMPPTTPLAPPPSHMTNPADLSMSSLHISDRAPRHPQQTPPSGPIPVPPMVSAPQGPEAPPYRRRRMSVSISDAGSMATIATAATSGTLQNPAHAPIPTPTTPSYPEHRGHRSPPEAPGQVENVHPPAPPFRRLSDGDRPVLSAPAVRYDPKTGQQYVSHHQGLQTASGQQQPPYPPHPEPQRRYSDGESSSAVARGFRAQHQEEQDYQRGQDRSRNVRWNEDLICPSPILPPPKRKGWFNRRGDQLWTNDGMFRPAPPDGQYPPELDDYPEHGEGWQNEDGVRIDMEHRRVPKVPRRSALKQAVFSAT